MFSFLNLHLKIAGLLESNISDREIAAGVCLGMFLGFVPLNGPMAVILAVCFFILKVNRVSALLTLPIFKLLYAAGLSSLIERFGSYLLIDMQSLTGLWRNITGFPVVAYFGFNNTLAAGGVITASALSVPVYFIAKKISCGLRRAYGEKLKDSKISRVISGLKFVHKVDTVISTDSRLSITNLNIRRSVTGYIKKKLFWRRKAKAAPTGIRKRVNARGLGIILAALIALQFGVGLIISPMAGSLIVDLINRTNAVKISAEKINIWPLTLSLTLKGLKIFDPKNTGEKIAKADTASIRVNPVALLSKRFVFSCVKLDGVEVNLEGSLDGSFNIQNISRPKEGAAAKGISADDAWKFVSKNKDWFDKLHNFLVNKYSKQAQERRNLEKAAKKNEKTITALPRGKEVKFRYNSYLFEINYLMLSNALINFKAADGQAIEIGNANLRLGRLAFDPENGARLGLFALRGDVRRQGAAAGSADILFSQNENNARMNIDLKDIDLDALRFVYQDSLPVNVERGLLTLSSRTSIRGNAINSRNEVSLNRHKLAAKDTAQVAFGIVPVTMIVEALNNIQPVSIEFTVTGTVEDPEFGGFSKSLMGLINPYISNIKEKAIDQGIKALQGILGKKLFGKSEEPGSQ